MTIDVKKISDTEVEITGSLPADELGKHREVVIAKLGDMVEVDGFRRGHIPENVLVSKVGEARILEEMAERALSDAYPKIIINNNIDAIGRPEITITKLAEGNPIEFKIKQAVMPKFDLPDYKKIAGEAKIDEAKDIEDKDVEDVITEIRKQRKSRSGLPDRGSSIPDESGSGQNQEELPPLDDAFAQSLGDFKNVDELKEKIKKNMTLERQMKQKSLRRQKIIDGILEETKFTMPSIFVEREMDTLLAELKDDIAHMGVKFEDYLKHINKTESELREGSRATAEKRAKSWIILAKIAEVEKIEVPKELLEQETQKVLGHYQGADPLAARSYVEGILKNELVFEMLEKAA